MNFRHMIESNSFTVVVSLPANDLDLARAALDAGAQAIKVHCNVWHRASGHTFGTYAENREFLRQLITMCGEVPVGLVPGGAETVITPGERRELEQMGLGFFSAYSRNLPCHMMESPVLTKMVAIDSGYTPETLDAVRDSDIDVLECSILPGEHYGTALCYDDILRFHSIAVKTAKPCLIPTQRRIQPSEVSHLYHAGCKAIMIGAVVMGSDPGPRQVYDASAAFRKAVDALPSVASAKAAVNKSGESPEIKKE